MATGIVDVFNDCSGLHGKADNFCLQAKHAQNLSESMFADDESASLPLDRCMRVLPHHDDTGGFFIAVFQKKAHLPQLQAQR